MPCRGVLHRPHLGGAAHILPQVQPGAVGGAGHHQVHELAVGTVADTVNAVPHPDECPLLLGLVVILAQADVTAVLCVLHSLDHAASLGSNGIKTIRLNDGLCNQISLQFPP